jgi:hypothetical protein
MNMYIFEDEPCCAKLCPKLTFKQRLGGFVLCAAAGYILSFIGSLILFTGNITSFAVLYVIGNVIALCATGFLISPRSQCRKMWLKKRRVTTAIYLSLLIIVFSVAIAHQNVILVLFLLILEIIAGCWYALSYIPFGRKMMSTLLKNTICSPCNNVYEAIRPKKKSIFPKFKFVGLRKKKEYTFLPT